MTMAAAPLSMTTRAHASLYSDVDAEGDEDIQEEANIPAAEAMEDPEDADEDAEGSEVDAQAIAEDSVEEESDEGISVKRSQRNRKRPPGVESDDEAMEEGDASGDEDSSAAEVESDKDSSDAESAAAEDWEAASEGAEDPSLQLSNRNNCV